MGSAAQTRGNEDREASGGAAAAPSADGDIPLSLGAVLWRSGLWRILCVLLVYALGELVQLKGFNGTIVGSQVAAHALITACMHACCACACASES